MAEAQVQGMFGQREQSSRFARKILADHEEFTGVSIGYEPDADGRDGEYVGSPAAEEIGNAFGPDGRFLVYWFRDKLDSTRVDLEPLVDMEESQYYQGSKEQLLRE